MRFWKYFLLLLFISCKGKEELALKPVVLFCKEADETGCLPPISKSKLKYRLPAPAKGILLTEYLNSVFPLEYSICMQYVPAKKMESVQAYYQIIKQTKTSKHPIELFRPFQRNIWTGCVPLVEILDNALAKNEPVTFIPPQKIKFILEQNGKKLGFRTLTLEIVWYYSK